jgi:pSer/pThr/pTyr-binding forkhead associated (FHA) protein
MKGLARFESFAEQLVEGSFARLLGSRLEPVEIAKQLARVMDDRQIIGAGKVYVPNRFQVFLHPDTLAEFASFQHALEGELEAYLAEVADQRNYNFLGKPQVALQANEGVKRNQLRIEAQLNDAIGLTSGGALQMTQEMRVRAQPDELAWVLFVDKREIRLTQPAYTVGRSLDNDIIVDDPTISRRHAQLIRSNDHYALRDLRSRNGTFVNGQRISEVVLRDGDLLTLGDVGLVFKRLSGASPPGDQESQPQTHQPDQATRPHQLN